MGNKVRKGRLLPVSNDDRKFGSANEYFALWVEDADGNNERVLLFTAGELQIAETRANINPEDIEKVRKGWLTDLLD